MRYLLLPLFLFLGLASAHARFASRQTFEDRLRAAELAGDRDAVAAICREWYASGQFSAGILNWNFNALMSVEDNAVLFTGTDNDTYPAFLLQNALAIRPDVTILNVSLLEQAAYRNLIAQTKNYTWIQAEFTRDQFIDAMLSVSRGRGEPYFPVYFSLLSDKNTLGADQSQLYITGLALKYSTKPFDNLAMLRFNFENRFRTDYLELNLQPESDPATVAQLNLNYIPALLLLHRHYTTLNENARAARVELLALHIARKGNREAEALALFGQDYPETPVQSLIPFRSLEKPMKKISGQLYAAETEVTNSQYELFLQDLVRNKEFDLLAGCRTAKTDWRALLPSNLRNLSDEQLYKNGHPDGPESPVQNISHEAAKAYCDWITQVYNSSPGKKKYKKVLFRLPTEEEWIQAAESGRKDVPYPWGGYFLRNSKGCYLCNLKAIEPCGDCPEGMKNDSNDGGFFTVPANSYFPNDFGLYCVAGNVAEMIREPGITKGGSWMDEPYNCQIRTVQTQAAPSPAVGFRVFMEVIEE